ncbi:hypothetical protein [Hyphomicrobium zavarzinii]|jgi:hypothetical protein|uniref:hypothetical protein n=1 Tax=Hyphomicrobium zavarzinii TaxID=48292 RepID=UPI0012EC6EF2|nr:hypothetical protein [Hyphomicrobium zavarzinii]
MDLILAEVDRFASMLSLEGLTERERRRGIRALRFDDLPKEHFSSISVMTVSPDRRGWSETAGWFPCLWACEGWASLSVTGEAEFWWSLG